MFRDPAFIPSRFGPVNCRTLAAEVMDVWFNVRSYNTYGGHRTISLVGSWLQEHRAAPRVGLAELELEANLRHVGPPKKTLERICEQFHNELSGLPLVLYSGKKKHLKIRFRSELGDARAITKNRDLAIELFLQAFDELIAVLDSIPLEKKKGLNARALRDWVLESRGDAPGTIDELQKFEASYRAAAKRRVEAMSPWERLSIDWGEFHPAARSMLDEPFFWSGIDDHAPHGNDTGADLLEILRGNPAAAAHPLKFLKQVFDAWGMEVAIESALAKPLNDLVESEETALCVWDEAAIALAYGLAKLHGRIPAEASELALDAVNRERELADARGLRMDEERLTALATLEKKLLEIRG